MYHKIERKTIRDIYPQETQHILQRVEKENLMGYSYTGNSNQNQVAPQTMLLCY